MGKTKTNRDYTPQKTRKISNRQAKLSRKRIRKRIDKTESQRKEGNSKDQRQKKNKQTREPLYRERKRTMKWGVLFFKDKIIKPLHRFVKKRQRTPITK